MSRELFKCGHCQSYDEPTRTCRYDPPVTALIGLTYCNNSTGPGGGFTTGTSPTWETRWPAIKPDDWCRKWNAQ